jgi:hypothetical protein
MPSFWNSATSMAIISASTVGSATPKASAPIW